MQSDLLIHICARLDIDTLKKLASTTLWYSIREFAGSNYYWYLRVQFKSQSEIACNISLPMKELYYLVAYKLESYLAEQNHTTRISSLTAAM